MQMIQYRHEMKHEISRCDLMLLRQRLRAVMKPDRHAVDGKYEIRSLYFDNMEDKALREFCAKRSDSISMQLANNETVNDMSYADASDLNLSDMGTMGMGGGFKGGFGGTNKNR